MRDAFYGGETTAKRNRSARIVVEGRKARERRVEERKGGHGCPRKHANEKDGGKWTAV